MELKINSIVKHVNTKEVYEVIDIKGSIVLCNPINLPSLKNHQIPFKINELEVMMEEETDAFDILFGNKDE